MDTKICSKCKKEKFITEFNNYTKLNGKIGKRTECKACKKRPPSYWKEYYSKNKDKVAEYHRKYRERNEETLKRRSREYYRKNKKHCLENGKKYYQSHKKEHAEITKKYKIEHKEELKLKTNPTLKEHFQKLEIKKAEERESKFQKELLNKEIRKDNLTKESIARKKEYFKNWCKKNRQRVNAYGLKHYYKRMKEIHGIEWETTKYKGEELTCGVIKTMFPNVKILRGFEGSIDTLGTCRVRKHVWPDFTFSLLDKKVIIEYNGDQHYKCFPPITQKRFINLKKRDRWLRKYCKKNNIILIEIRQKKVGYNKDKIASKIKDELHKHGIYEPMDANRTCPPIQCKAS